MHKVKPKVGQGRFQWNAGGWFGSLFGSTAFLLVGAVVFAPQSIALAVVWLVCYGAAVGCGIFIWTRRESLYPYPATQSQLFVVGIAATVAILCAFFTQPDLLADNNTTPKQALLVLLIVPGLMLSFHLSERTARRATI